MAKTLIFATGALALAAITIFRRWRRRAGAGAEISDQIVSEEWLAQARSNREETW